MNLNDVLRKEEINNKFDQDVYFEQYGKESLNILIEKEPAMFFEIGGHAWMRFLSTGTKVNPQKLYLDFRNKNPLVYKKVEKIIKRNIIQDLSFSYGYVRDEDLIYNQCCQLLLFRIWPNELLIADVTFTNPYKPVETAKYNFHQFKSLGLFASHLKKIKEYCKEQHIEKITLSTASNDQITYFEEHGFIVEDSEFARQALKNEQGVPMTLNL
ncbi:hypothetical protein [Photobacterium iliopiscarium]|uniref:Uncharacterized protein n=1 Tax=Photobacterium iliopiscarium TaxID=56192 RepID=A0A2T3MP71_9GAMM|nr:hypothetical protein [Photobacterium iliopiscarium]PSV98735.1 hypothetical protein C9I88_04725 [Photobacterium iliopiscarium]